MAVLVRYCHPGITGNHERRTGVQLLPTKEHWLNIYKSLRINGGTVLERKAPEGWNYVDLPEHWYMMPCDKNWDIDYYELPKAYAIVFDETGRQRYRLTYTKDTVPFIEFAPRYFVTVQFKGDKVRSVVLDGTTVRYRSKYEWYDDDFGSEIGTRYVRAKARAWLEVNVSMRRHGTWWRFTASDFDGDKLY